MTTPLWTPLESRVSQTTLHLFSPWLSSRTGKSLFGYEELHTFSIDDPATFWSALGDFTKISRDKGEPPSSSTATRCRAPGSSPGQTQLRRKPAVPARLIQVADIPRSKSGKISGLAVRDIVHGRDIKNREALANPEVLDIYRNMAELAQ